MESEELDELRKNFRSYILPYLDGDDRADYDLVWLWEKFLYEKGRRLGPSKSEQAEPSPDRREAMPWYLLVRKRAPTRP